VPFAGPLHLGTVDAISGAFKPVKGSPFQAGSSPLSVSVDPIGRFAYVSTNGSSATDPPAVWAYTIDPSSGALPPVRTGPFGAGALPIAINVDPSGQFVYEASFGSNTIVGYRIDATTGALNALPSSPTTAGTGTAPDAISFDPSGKFLYAANQTSGNISAFNVNPITGALKAVAGSPFVVGASPSTTGPSTVTVDPSGRFLYGAGYFSGAVAVASINPTTGALLSNVPGSPSVFAGGVSDGFAVWGTTQ
jgi:6-phosphogluconolactonase